MELSPPGGARAQGRTRLSSGPMGVPLMDLRGQWAELMPRAKAAVLDVIDSGRFILGPEVAAFERESAERLGAAHAIGVANGTDAIVLALRALRIGPGEEVICPAYTFYATAEAIAAAGAVPVFADIDPATYCLDAAAVEAAVTPRTRAVVAVHLFGHPADVDALRAVCARHDLALIEDAAQAFGARLGERPVGGLGDVATFSFFPTKNLSTFGDGGLLTTRRRGARRAPAAAALPRLEGQADVRGDRRELAPRRAARRRSCACS